MQLQFFAPLMNTFMNESIYNLFLLCFWGAPAHQGTGRGRKGQGGSHYVRENAQLSGGEAPGGGGPPGLAEQCGPCLPQE